MMQTIVQWNFRKKGLHYDAFTMHHECTTFMDLVLGCSIPINMGISSQDCHMQDEMYSRVSYKGDVSAMVQGKRSASAMGDQGRPGEEPGQMQPPPKKKKKTGGAPHITIKFKGFQPKPSS